MFQKRQQEKLDKTPKPFVRHYDNVTYDDIVGTRQTPAPQRNVESELRFAYKEGVQDAIKAFVAAWKQNY